jgi:hypothetical protein
MADTSKRATQESVDSDVQKAVDAENAKGYRGNVADETPNENYTFGGQLAGKPTPEAGK